MVTAGILAQNLRKFVVSHWINLDMTKIATIILNYYQQSKS
jgi:hypothetical protein